MTTRRPTMRGAPPTPPGVPRGWLASTRRDWATYWSSDAARLLDDVDVDLALRLFGYRDQLTRLRRRLDPENQRQLIAVRSLEGMVGRLEAQLGIGPAARGRLDPIQSPAAVLSALEELRSRRTQRDDDDGVIELGLTTERAR